jgi:4,5-DOPA dioxygenase extradiol
MRSAPTEIATMDSHRDFGKAVPTPDHFLPLLYLAGMAGAGDSAPDILVDGYAYGSLSMTSYTLDLTTVITDPDAQGAAPQTPDAPPEASNI